MTGLTHEDLQPQGNAAAQDQVGTQSGGGSILDAIVDFGQSMWDDVAAGFWWDAYKAAGESARQQMAHDAWQDGTLQRKIDALNTDEQVDPLLYRDELGEVLDYLQQFEMMRSAGQTWEEMSATQATFMTEQARQRVQEQNPSGPAPSDADLQEAHEEAVDEQDYLADEDTSWWDGLTPVEQAMWIVRGAVAIVSFVAYAQRVHPELDVQASEIGVDMPGNSNSVAYVDSAGKCWIGKSTIVAIERNPAYATSTILHELRGHPEFDTGFALGMELYDAAAPQMPGYTRPAEDSDERYAEWRRFDYFESEIGALMRETSFWVASEDLDSDGTIEASERNPLGAPDDLLDTLLRNLGSQFAPQLCGPFIIGLARRFEADPRISDAANTMFAAGALRVLGVQV